MKLRFGSKIKIWYRNSLKFNYVKFLKSDIDITILILENSSTDLANNIYTYHLSIRSILKIFGELAIYYKRDLSTISNYINKFELKRDPELLRLIYTQTDFKTTREEALIFIFQFYLANFNKLKKIKSRNEKLNFYLNLIQAPIINFEELPSYILSFYDIIDSNSTSRIYNIINNSDYSTADFNHPIEALLFTKLIYSNSICLPATNRTKELILYSVYWEIWGCYAHKHMIPKMQTINHFKKIIQQIRLFMPEKIVTDIERDLIKLGLLQS